MPDPGQELSSINFSNMIGGPLRAVIEAQAEAALSTVNFIKSVGFKPGSSTDPEATNTGDPIYVTFRYPKLLPATPEIPATDDTAAVPAVPAGIRTVELQVPILSILPIPCIRVDEFTLKFNAKIDSMEYTRTDTSTSVSGNLTVNQRWPSGSARLNVSASHQRSTTQGTNVQRSYALDIYVKAVQDELPAGLERVLGILDRSMQETPVPLPPPPA